MLEKLITYNEKKMLCGCRQVLINLKATHTKPFIRSIRCNRNYSIQTAGYKINLKVNNVSLSNYIEKLRLEYESPVSNERRLRLKPVMSLLKARDELVANINNLSELLHEGNEDSLKKLAEEEKVAYEEKIKTVDNDLLQSLLTINTEDDCNSIVLEVNAGVGGQEAMLFAKELFEMYSNFSDYKGWDFEIAEYAVTDLGGIRFGSALINGESVLRYFKQEAGVHRVQRIPSTEKSGRIHTSTVAVVALPQPTDIQISLESKDLRIETKRASGAGGQHVNTTDSAVRIVHLPSGVSVECQVGRSQIKNKQIAMAKLRALLYQQQLDEQELKRDSTRKSQVRTNYRNEKIRTYNFSQDRITDHRLQGVNVHNLKGFMEGGAPLDDLISKVYDQTKVDCLLEAVQSFNNK